MIPLTICVGLVAFILWAARRYERAIRILAKRYEEKVHLDVKGTEAAIRACDLLMEIHDDPQSDEYRTAMELKLRLERKARV